MIKIDFEKISADGAVVYRDALHLPDDHTYSDADIEAMKQTRFDNWYAIVTTVHEPLIDPMIEQI